MTVRGDRGLCSHGFDKHKFDYSAEKFEVESEKHSIMSSNKHGFPASAPVKPPVSGRTATGLAFTKTAPRHVVTARRAATARAASSDNLCRYH